jgi:predicted dehydrogenase
LNILIVGLGSIAKKHITAINKIKPEAKIYAYRSNLNSENMSGVINIYDIKDIKFALDFIIVSNPTIFHEESILKFLKFSCPLFIEKPALSNIDNAQYIIQKIKDTKVKTYIGCNMRFHPSIIFLKKYLSENIIRINEVNIYCGSYLPTWRPDKDFRNIYSINPFLGGGVHLDLIHELDYCIWLFGIPNESIWMKGSSSSLNIDSLDYSLYHLNYTKFNVDIKLNYYRKDPKREIEILTAEDTLVVNLITNCIYSSYTGKVFLENNNYSIIDTYYDQMQYFINSLESNVNMMNPIEENIEVLKIALHEKT